MTKPRFKQHVLTFLLLLLLAGCHNTSSTNLPRADQTPRATVFTESPPLSGTLPQRIPSNTPHFTGPWAAEFTHAYQSVPSEFARQILAKEEISDSDFAETQERNKACLEAENFTNIVHHPQGGMNITPPEGMTDDEVQKRVDKCSDESGLTQIEPLYNGILTNPNNEDWDQLVVQCLIDQKVVEPSFTVADFQSWFDNEDPRLLTGGSAQNCTDDPLRRTGSW